MQDSSRSSNRVCKPCGRRTRNLGQWYHFVENATATTSSPVKTSKENLNTPDKASPPQRKSKSVRVSSPIAKTPSGKVPPKRSKESLAFEITANTASTSFVQENEMLSQLIVEDLPNDGVKIVFVN